MMLFTTSFLAMAMEHARDNMENIAAILESLGICSASEFMEATTEQDSARVDAYLEKAIEICTCKDNALYGMELYCEKFGIEIPDKYQGERSLLQLISDNSDKIEKTLADNGI